jgi:hypothetical protein
MKTESLLQRGRAGMAKSLFTLAAAGLMGAPIASAHKIAPPKESKVQVAILLDTSSSMSGLIEQTKTQLWKIVNTFVEAEQHGKVPFVEVALYEYGNSKLHAGENWVHLIQPLTRDLDAVSEDLFALRTQGGEEYCGAVIKRATEELEWDSNPDVYKAIFIAGNEPFNQGPIDPAISSRKASAMGIFVNTIHCGGEQAGVSGGWKSGASISDGKFLNINQNKAVVHIKAPQDKKILELNIHLNSTYIPMGVEGQVKAKRQVAQDNNALANASSGAAVNRAWTKSTSNYRNDSWDLVDASQDEKFDWASLKKDELPEEYRGLTTDERKVKVAQVRAKRVQIQKEIQGLNDQRLSHVKAEQAKLTKGGAQTLDDVVVATVKDQAAKRGYKFAKK